MMEPHEEPLVQVDIDSIPCDIESKPSYVEFSSECGDSAKTSAPVVADVEEDVIGEVVSSTRPFKMWKFIVPLTLIAAVSGTIATVSRYEAAVKEMKTVNENQPIQPTIDADKLLYVAPETTKKSRANNNVTASKVSKDGSRTKGSKASPTEGGGSTGAESMSMNMMFGIDDANALIEAEATSSQPQFIITAKAEKASKGSKSAGGITGGEATGGGVQGGSMSMETTVDLEQHEFDVNSVSTTNLQTHALNMNIGSSQQGVQKASKGSKTTTLNTSKASKETVTATTTVPGVEAGGGSMSMETTERTLETFGMTPGYEDSEAQNGPVFHRRKYIDNHLL